MESLLIGNDNKGKLHLPGAIYHKSCSACAAPAKYCCPKCSALSCSLDCVKAHKVTKECDGIRSQTTYVPVEAFKEKHLLNDYHFLEEVGRTIDNASRGKRNHGSLYYKPINLDRLRKVAWSRKTKLEILPIVFSRRKISTTYLRYSDNKIFWRIEWEFPLCNISFSDERIDEETLLGKCLDKYLYSGDSELDEKLVYYQSIGHKEVAVLLKNENAAANDLKYYVLRQNKSLKLNFKHKRIIEFPTLLIVPKMHLSAYPLMNTQTST